MSLLRQQKITGLFLIIFLLSLALISAQQATAQPELLKKTNPRVPVWKDPSDTIKRKLNDKVSKTKTDESNATADIREERKFIQMAQQKKDRWDPLWRDHIAKAQERITDKQNKIAEAQECRKQYLKKLKELPEWSAKAKAGDQTARNYLDKYPMDCVR
jgi:hypothetical protein